MGTDIHTAVEIHRDGQWQFAGRVFDSTHGWDYLPADRDTLESFDDERLISALNFYVLHATYGTLKYELSDETVAIFRQWEARREIDRDEHKAFVDAYRNADEWDYDGVVKPHEWNQRAARRDDFENVFTAEQREEIIVAALKKFNKPDEDGYFDPSPLSIDRRADEPPFKSAEPFDCRNYDLFAALADVRNGRGFAGVYTGDPIVPIADPRGLPEDVDPETVKQLSDEHTASWLTLAELKDYDWDQPKISGGIVSGRFYDLLVELQGSGDLYPWEDDTLAEAKRRDITDTGVSGGISGGGIRTFSQEEYKDWKANTLSPTSVKPYVSIKWERPLRNSINTEFFDGVAAMDKLVEDGYTDDDVRLVFDFDS